MGDHLPELSIGHVVDGNVIAEVGGVVSGYVHLAPDDDLQPGEESRVRGIRIELGYATEGRGDLDEETVASVDLPSTVDGAVSGHFQLTVPPDAPVTYYGHLFGLVWELRAIVDIEMRLDRSASYSVVVLPQGGSVW